MQRSDKLILVLCGFMLIGLVVSIILTLKLAKIEKQKAISPIAEVIKMPDTPVLTGDTLIVTAVGSDTVYIEFYKPIKRTVVFDTTLVIPTKAFLNNK